MAPPAASSGCLHLCATLALVATLAEGLILSPSARTVAQGEAFRGTSRVLQVLTGPPASDETAREEAVVDGSVIHVAYGTTRDGFPGLLHSMISLARHFRRDERCKIHVIVMEEDLATVQQVMRCFHSDLTYLGHNATTRISTKIHKMRPLGWDASRMRTSAEGAKRNWGHQEKLSRSTVFARFYLQDYVPEATRVLWLDVDTIVTTSVGPLFRMPMTHPVAAKNTHNFSVGHAFPHWGCIGHVDATMMLEYINTGVLLVDLNRWRTNNFTRRLEKAAADCVVNDQPAFNIVFGLGRDVDFIQAPWNVMALGSPAMSPGHRKGNILHWSGPVKPWEELPKCKTLRESLGGASRVNDTDCLNWKNLAEYASYAGRRRCEAVEPQATL